MIILAALAFQGFSLAINGVAAPWMMTGFSVDQAGMARAFAWISLSAIGSFLLARQADRHGRRRVLAASMAIGAAAAVAAAFSTSLALFIAFDAIVLSTAGAVVAGAVVWMAEPRAGSDTGGRSRATRSERIDGGRSAGVRRHSGCHPVVVVCARPAGTGSGRFSSRNGHRPFSVALLDQVLNLLVSVRTF